MVLLAVKKVRRHEKRAGVRKLHHRIQPTLNANGTKIGRDRLFRLLREKGMLVKPKKRFQKTTYSKHSYAVAPNRFKDMEVTRVNQAFVSDITYITLRSGFAYLFLVTDVFSRNVVGYHLSRDLTHHSALLALDMATSRVSDTTGILHHSDRGCQYCCHEYLNFLSMLGMVPSMTDDNHCYQNAIAERVNGILKLELDLDAVFAGFTDAHQAVHRAVRIYNEKRTHWSLDLRTPKEVYELAA